jgi:HK97 gp10 family phage protein
MIKAWIVGTERVIGSLDQIPGKVAAALRQAVEAEAIKLTAYVKEQKLSGQALKTQTGTLQRSINYQLQDEGDRIAATVGTNLVYAGIHEYGGTTRAHVIEAREAKTLAFQMGGQDVFFKRVNHPGSHMPERSFLRSSLEENAGGIRVAIEAAVAEGIKS